MKEYGASPFPALSLSLCGALSLPLVRCLPLLLLLPYTHTHTDKAVGDVV